MTDEANDKTKTEQTTVTEKTEEQPTEPNSLGNVTKAVTEQPTETVTETTVTEKTEES